MATTEQPKVIGKMDCIVCREEIPVKQNGRDTLNVSCPWCGVSAYAKGGTQAARLLMGKVRKSAPAPEEKKPAQAAPAAKKDPAPAPTAPAPAAKPEKKALSTIFD